MKTNFLKEAILISSLLPILVHAQNAPSIRPAYSHSELKRLMRTAHTPEEFNALADYFDGKRQQFARKALDEKNELDYLLTRPYLVPKYPSPVDSARRLLQYYGMKAEECGRRADSFRLQAKPVEKTAATPARP